MKSIGSAIQLPKTSWTSKEEYHWKFHHNKFKLNLQLNFKLNQIKINKFKLNKKSKFRERGNMIIPNEWRVEEI